MDSRPRQGDERPAYILLMSMAHLPYLYLTSVSPNGDENTRWCGRFVGMSGGSESLAAHVHPELKDCAKAVSNTSLLTSSR